MAIKRLSNGKTPRTFEPRASEAASVEWARSVVKDPSRSFTLLVMTTDLVFLSAEEQKQCVGMVVTAPIFLPGAEPERLLTQFEAALDQAARSVKLPNSEACHIYHDGALPAQGRALAHAFASPGYEMGRNFFGLKRDPRKARRKRRKGILPALAFGQAESDEEWDAAINAIVATLRRRGFEVIMAPWITRDHAGSLDQLGFRERARAFLDDLRLESELREELVSPQGAVSKAL